MYKYIYVPFNEELNSAAFAEVTACCSLIFPTHASVRQAQRSFMPRWNLEQISWLTIQEFVSSLIPPPLADLQDQKRLLCLWQVLTDEDKAVFHLDNYEDLLSWGHSFFAFFEELKDELIEVEALKDSTQLNTREWQEDRIQRALDILLRYEDFIKSKGFTDAIFYLDPQNMVLPQKVQKLIFVNQYYFSALEKLLIKSLDEAGFEIVILHQGSSDSFDEANLKAKALQIKDIPKSEIALQELNIIQSKSLSQMSVAFLSVFGAQKEDILAEAEPQRRVLIDAGMQQSGYSRLFDPSYFGLSLALNMQKTQLFSLLKLYESHLHALALLQDKDYLLLSEIAKAVGTPGFIQIYIPDANVDDSQKILDQLRSLAKDSVLYIDLDLQLFQDKQPHEFQELNALLIKHFNILKKLMLISNTADLIQLFDEEGGIWLNKLCSAEELKTDIIQNFYERLDNFKSIEELGLVQNWQLIFAKENRALAHNIFKIWLDHLTAAKIKSTLSKQRVLYQQSNLLDSRNLSYDEVVVFNCMEGVLPKNSEPVWLLNEAQKQKLGLKNYDTIRSWERYYFLRLILSSKKSTLYCYVDLDKNLEPSAYLNELRQHFEHKLFEAKAPADLLSLATGQGYPKKPLYPIFEASNSFDYDDRPGSDFFILPCEPQRDFLPELKLSSYSINRLTTNPFSWYITNRRKIEAIDLMAPETMSPILFGNIMHAYLNLILSQAEGENNSLSRLEDAFSDTDGLKEALFELLESSEWDHKMPQNYNKEFLFGVIADCLVDSVQKFYHNWLKVNLAGTSFEFIPEKSNEKPQYKELLRFGDDEEYSLQIGGRADLRIQTPEKDYIVDFKTGSTDRDQLIFYEYFYHRLDPQYTKVISSLFWKILDAVADEDKDKDKYVDQWKTRVENTLQACLETGYQTGVSLKDKELSQAITRTELQRATKKEEA